MTVVNMSYKAVTILSNRYAVDSYKFAIDGYKSDIDSYKSALCSYKSADSHKHAPHTINTAPGRCQPAFFDICEFYSRLCSSAVHLKRWRVVVLLRRCAARAACGTIQPARRRRAALSLPLSRSTLATTRQLLLQSAHCFQQMILVLEQNSRLLL